MKEESIAKEQTYKDARCVFRFLSSYSWLVEARRDIPKNAFIEAELHNPADFAKPLKVTAIELQAQDGESPW